MKAEVEPILVGKREAARLCGLGQSTWDRYRQLGWAPQPVRIGNTLRWNRAELLAWIEAGCPRAALG